MADWAVAPLADVLEFREGPGIMAVDFRDAGVPLVRLAGVKRGADIFEGANHLDPAMVDKRWSQFCLQEGDVLLSTSASLGEVARVPAKAAGAIPYTGIISFRPRDSRIDAAFIPYMLTAPTFKGQIEAMGVGSVMKHFGPSHLRQMTVRYPDRGSQRAIAEVLGAIDDKIAANDRVQSGVVTLTDALFNRAVVGLEAGPLTFGEVAEVSGGGTPKTSVDEYWGGDIAWSTPTDVTGLGAPYLRQTARTITDLGLASCSSSLYPTGSILMTSRATIGAFAIAQIPVAVNQGFIVVNAKDPAMQWWLYHEMRARVPEFLSFANGATFLELPRGRFRELPVRLPSSVAARDFAESVGPMHEAAAQISVESALLAKTRDELLPLLMSGRLRVKDAENSLDRVL